MSEDRIELKPCPFCGGSARVCAYPECFDATCNECDASIAMVQTETEAAEAWNRRAAAMHAPAPGAELPAELVALLERCCRILHQVPGLELKPVAVIDEIVAVLQQHTRSSFVRTLAARQSGAVQAPKDGAWQPIETAPKDGDEVDLFGGGRRWTDCYFHQGEWLQWESSSVDEGPHHARVLNPTHWMRVAPPAVGAPR